MKRYGNPRIIVTDKPRSHDPAMKVVGNARKQETGRWNNNLAKHTPPTFCTKRKGDVVLSAM